MNSQSKHCMGRVCVGVVLIWGAVSVASDLPDHVVLYHNFDEAGVDILSDMSGYQNDAVIEGHAEWEDSQYGKAFVLNGAEVVANVPASDSLTSLKAPMTVGALFRPVSLPDGYRKMLGMYGTPGARSTGWAFEFNGKDFNFVLFGKKNYWGPVMTVGEWIYIIAVFDGDTVVYYVNGDRMAPIDAEGHDTDVSQSPGLWLGAEDGTLGMQAVDMTVDEVWISNKALNADEVNAVMRGQWRPNLHLASDPAPEDQATDVLRDTVLRWTPGVTAQDHHVYLGTDFDDVNDASLTDTRGLLTGQSTSSQFDPGRLDFDSDYFWRVDEVNGAPDFTAFKGKVWSFATEALAYPVANVTATSNALSGATDGPENTVNGSGLNENDEHSTEVEDMWLGAPTGDDLVTIEYAFDKVCKLHEMVVWNYNVRFELALGFGLKEVTVEYSENGVDWTTLRDVTLAQGTAQADYAANTTINFGGAVARYVRLTVNSGYGTMGQFGLSEVRFLAIPVSSRAPQPADGESDVSSDAVLSWHAGREAVSHEVHFGTDEQAVTDGAALVDSVGGSSYTPGDLELGTTYYWKVGEVNEAAVPTTWDGAVWSFSTQEYLVVDDFESYNDEDNVIYETWIDGWVNETGSTVGYLEAPFAEWTIVHEGQQSMPFFYDNTSVATSEGDLTPANQDWTQAGITTLVLYFRGDSDNSGGQLYAKINGVKVAYEGDADALTNLLWQPWSIDLASVGTNLGHVTTLTIGVEGGSSGLIYVDDVRLYRSAPGN